MKPYFQNASVTLYHGDCFDIMPTLAPVAFDMLCSDPPFGIGEFAWDKDVDWDCFWMLSKRLLKVNACKALFCNIPCALKMVAANRLEFKYDLVWDKIRNSSPAVARRKPLRCHENIMVFYAKSPPYNPQMWAAAPYTMAPACRRAGRRFATLGEHAPVENRTARYPRSVFTISASYDSKGFGGYEFGNHPTQKPVAAYEWLVRTYTNDGETIFDPFAGAGTAGVAAMRTGRKAVLIELEEKWCEMAAKRLEKENA